MGVGGRGWEAKGLIFFYFCFLEFFNCRWIRGGGVEQKVLFKVSWNRIFLFLVLFKNGGRGLSSRFHLFVSGVNQGNEEAVWVQDILTWPQGWKDSPQISSCELLKIIWNVLWKWRLGCIIRPWVHRICNRKLISGEILWVDNLRLEPAMRNSTSGNQKIVLAMIRLVLTRVETEEISYQRLGPCVSCTFFRGWLVIRQIWTFEESCR